MAAIAARSIQASSELEHLLRQNTTRQRVKSSCTVLDDMLKGGLDSGRICCMSGDKSTGKTTIALQYLITYILSSKNLDATIIDTTGTFDVIRLHQSIVNMLQRIGFPGDVETEGERLLEKVRIVRVFDLIGIIEAVNEIREAYEMRIQQQSPRSARKAVRSRLGLVPDSEDEDEDELLELAPDQSDQSMPAAAKVGFIMIDNITSVMSPLLKANHVHGQSLLISFLRSISQFIRENNAFALILNSIIQNRSATSFQTKPDDGSVSASTPWLEISEDAYHHTNHPSIFMSNKIKPALGRSFAHLIDIHLLLSTIPKLKTDAQILYSSAEPAFKAYGQRKPDMINIIEVISDTRSNRIGRWAGFTITNGVDIKAA